MNRATAFLLGLLTAAIVYGLGVLLFAQDDAGTFVTRPGETKHAATGWRVTVDAETGRHTLAHGSSMIAPLWPMKTGWFVYLEDDAQAWSFNGDDQLLLFVAGRGPDDSGNAFGPDNAPRPVPTAVRHRIGDLRVRQLADAARAAKERLGITPGR
jgi:hypothetical protein